MTICFLHDRHLKSELESSHPDVSRSLRKRWSVMMEGGRETVAWVGIAQAHGSGNYFFLPHGAPSKADEQLSFASTLMQAIVRFAREHAREGEGRQFESATLAALLADLAADYRDYGLYSTREKLRTRQEGKPDWSRTVKNQVAFPAPNGAPVYCDIESIRYSSKATSIIARIQEHVIAEIHQNHGWWLTSYFGAREIPRPAIRPPWPRDQWCKLLRMARRELYQRRAIRLAGMLVAYLEASSESGEGEVICGISDFSTVWEVMLRDTISGVEPDWNSWLPRPSYFRPDGSGSPVTGMEIDIVARSGEHMFILDAKYYLATSKGYVPGVPDISKQYVYQVAVQSTGRVDPAKLVNAFIFPAESTGREPFHIIRFILPDGKQAAEFSSVKCQYLSVAEVVAAYASRRKFHDQSWLSELASAD